MGIVSKLQIFAQKIYKKAVLEEVSQKGLKSFIIRDYAARRLPKEKKKLNKDLEKDQEVSVNVSVFQIILVRWTALQILISSR